jgi:hypothetical protein
VVSGEVEFTTYDGLEYPLNVTGDYVFTRSKNRGVEIHTRLTFNPSISRTAVVQTAAGARIGTSQVAIRAGDEPLVRVNGRRVTIGGQPLVLRGGGRIERGGDQFTLIWPGGVELSVDASDSKRVEFRVTVLESLQGKLEGLVGDADGNRANDLRTRQGAVIPQPAQPDDEYRRKLNRVFAFSWLVSPSDSLIE